MAISYNLSRTPGRILRTLDMETCEYSEHQASKPKHEEGDNLKQHVNPVNCFESEGTSKYNLYV